MSAIRLGDEAPNFTAQSTEGEINFHDWLGDGWGSSMGILVHLAASFGTVVVVSDETSSSMLTAQAEKCENEKFCNLLQIGIQPHHHDRLAEISSNPPSNSNLVNVEARNSNSRAAIEFPDAHCARPAPP